MRNLKFALKLLGVNLAIMLSIYLALWGAGSFIELKNMWNVTLWGKDVRGLMVVWSLFLMAIATGVVTTVEISDRREEKW